MPSAAKCIIATLSLRKDSAMKNLIQQICAGLAEGHDLALAAIASRSRRRPRRRCPPGHGQFLAGLVTTG